MLSASLKETGNKLYPFEIVGDFNFLFKTKEEAGIFMQKIVRSNEKEKLLLVD
jgi:hypothetical protein